jgi:hypothetical protein
MTRTMHRTARQRVGFRGRTNRHPALVTTYPYADDFYGFGDTVLTNRTPAIVPINSSTVWNTNNSSFVLSLGHGEARFDTANVCQDWIDVTVQDHSARVEFEFPSDKGAVNVLLRFQDTSNNWLAQMDCNNNVLRIQSNVANTFTTRVTANYTVVVNTRYAIVFQVAGDIFTATYYQVINGVDTLITPASGSNPQTFDASAVGSGTGRTKCGMRCSSTLSKAAIRVYKFEASQTPNPVDTTITVAGSTTVSSRMYPAVSFVENPPVFNSGSWATMAPNIDSCTGATKVHIFPFGLLDPWPSNSSGKTASTPTNMARTDAAYLGQALQKIQAMNNTKPIILTLYGAEWFMKHTVNANVITDMTFSQQFSSSGRVKNAGLADWLIQVDSAVTVAAGYGVRDFEVWNELKGYYDTYPHVSQTWDASMNKGDLSGGANDKIVGYSYFYQQTANQVITTMTGLGIARNQYRIGGPYMLLNSQGVSDADSIGSSEPLYAYRNQWGYMDKEGVNALKQFLAAVQANSLPLDVLLLDSSTWNTDESYPTSDPFDLTVKYNHIVSYIRSILPTYGISSDIPIDFSEIYAMPQPALRTTDSGPLRAAQHADMLAWCMLNRVRYPILWGPTGAGIGGTGGPAGAPVSTAGALQATGTVCKYFKDNFAPGTALYACTSDNGNLGAVASLTKIICWNKTGNNLKANVDGDILDFTPYEVKLITR